MATKIFRYRAPRLCLPPVVIKLHGHLIAFNREKQREGGRCLGEVRLRVLQLSVRLSHSFRLCPRSFIGAQLSNAATVLYLWLLFATSSSSQLTNKPRIIIIRPAPLRLTICIGLVDLIIVLAWQHTAMSSSIQDDSELGSCNHLNPANGVGVLIKSVSSPSWSGRMPSRASSFIIIQNLSWLHHHHHHSFHLNLSLYFLCNISNITQLSIAISGRWQAPYSDIIISPWLFGVITIEVASFKIWAIIISASHLHR